MPRCHGVLTVGDASVLADDSSHKSDFSLSGLRSTGDMSNINADLNQIEAFRNPSAEVNQQMFFDPILSSVTATFILLNSS